MYILKKILSYVCVIFAHTMRNVITVEIGRIYTMINVEFSYNNDNVSLA